jgi:RES domain-containing protein
MFGTYPPSRENTGGARWNPRGVAAIYSSLERDTALAEAAYRMSLEPFRPRAKRTVYRIGVRLNHLVDISDRSVLAQLGVTEVDLSADDFSACQKVGGAVAWLGNDGLLVPSARAAGTNLVIFPGDDYDFEVLDSEDIVEG